MIEIRYFARLGPGGGGLSKNRIFDFLPPSSRAYWLGGRMKKFHWDSLFGAEQFFILKQNTGYFRRYEKLDSLSASTFASARQNFCGSHILRTTWYSKSKTIPRHIFARKLRKFFVKKFFLTLTLQLVDSYLHLSPPMTTIFVIHPVHPSPPQMTLLVTSVTFVFINFVSLFLSLGCGSLLFLTVVSSFYLM